MFSRISAFCCFNPKLTKHFPNVGIYSLSDGTKPLITTCLFALSLTRDMEPTMTSTVCPPRDLMLVEG